MGEYSKIAKGNFISSGSAQIINLPFQPQRVELWNYTAANTNPTSQNIMSGVWDASMGQGAAIIQGYNATPSLVYDVVSANGISTFAAGTLLTYGPIQRIGASGSITSSSSSVTTIVTTTPHGLTSGQVVIFQDLYQTSTTGMQQFAGIPFIVAVSNSTTFTINWNASGSNYTTITGSSGALPAAAAFKVVNYPSIYEPGVNFISQFTPGTGTFNTTAQHNFQVGQQIAFRIPPTWGCTELNSLPNSSIPGSPVYYYISAVTATAFTVVENTSAVTALDSNQIFGAVVGFPQVVAVGDVNTGGQQIYAGSPLYPSPLLYNSSLTQAPTINGPAIQGAFINNTSQGFIVGAGAGRILTTGKLVGASTNVIYWTAYYTDLAVS